MNSQKPQRPSMLEAYCRAAEFLKPAFNKSLPGAEMMPFWQADGRSLFYRRYYPGGTEFIEFEIDTGLKRPAFDHTAVAAALGKFGISCAAASLPFSVFNRIAGSIRFNLGGRSFVFDLTSGTLDEAAPQFTRAGRRSPDSRAYAFVRDGNVHLSREGAADRQLTRDAEPHDAYGAWPESNLFELARRKGSAPLAPPIGWSPDSRYFLIHKLDERAVKPLHLVQSIGEHPHDRPVVHSYRYALPIDRERPWSTLSVVDAQAGSIAASDAPAVQTMVQPPLPDSLYWWAEDSSLIFFLHWSQGRRRLVLYSIEPATGKSRAVVTETSQTLVRVTHVFGARPNIRFLHGTGELIWFSEESGWGHLYLIDTRSGERTNAITSGEWLVDSILHVDLARRRVYFSARGRDPRRDPYERYIYRVDLDGSHLQLLTPEPGDHRVHVPAPRTSHSSGADEIAFITHGFSPCGNYFAETHSSARQAPVSLVRRAEDGAVIVELERADTSAMTQLGWQPAERLELKARDGHTPIYATLWRPHDFDPSANYPLIDISYPGPFVTVAPAVFTPPQPGNYFNPEALCALGFAVVMVDGLGTPYRSKSFADFAYGNIGDAGLADHVAAFEQISTKMPWCDTTRVGILGSSAGGFAAARAMFVFPDVFKVGVSMCGGHDLRMYHAAWAEIFQGVADRYEDIEAKYAGASNIELADRLRGKLLIAHGELDENVHPAVSLRLIERLIAANKDFEFLLIPNGDHFIKSNPYLTRRSWDFFVRHLLGREPPKEFQIQ